MVFLNQSDHIGKLINYATINITGSEFLTYFWIILILYLFCILFKMDNALALTLLLPIILVLMAYSSSWLMVGGILLIYLSFIFVSMWPVK